MKVFIKERQIAFGIWKEGNKIRVSTGTELQNILKDLGLIYQQAAQTEIKGNIGCKGKVTGRVVVVLIPAHNSKVEKGMILVAPETTPDFVPAMGRAAAFITDQGGVTSHAAIIAREMGKPCIIGTKIATQVLKDGDLVEVDADNGVVRIIKEKNEKSGK